MSAGRIERRVEQLMGMPINLALRGPLATGARADRAWESILEQLREVDRTFSTYREDSVISRLGRGEIGLADCPPELQEVLDLGERARVESDGAFDVRRPGPSGRIELDPSDMVCRSRMTDSPGWQVGVEDPLDPTRVVAVIPIHDGAVATSGLTQRAGHITDPRTGLVPDTLASITVVAEDLTWADIDATAAFVLGARARTWLEGRGRAGILVATDGEAETFGYDADAG
jgi:thiamine biosynthesis lipoprotein